MRINKILLPLIIVIGVTIFQSLFVKNQYRLLVFFIDIVFSKIFLIFGVKINPIIDKENIFKNILFFIKLFILLKIT